MLSGTMLMDYSTNQYVSDPLRQQQPQSSTSQHSPFPNSQDQLQNRQPAQPHHDAFSSFNHPPPSSAEQSAQSHRDSFAHYTNSPSMAPTSQPSNSMITDQQQHVSGLPDATPPHPQHTPPHAQEQNPAPPPPPAAGTPQFDIFEWYPKHQSCQRYFLNHAQSSPHVQAVAAFINIHLPFQKRPPTAPPPATSSSTRSPLSPTAAPSSTTPRPTSPSSTSISLLPYLRRLVITGLDLPGVLHGFFGDDWAAGVGPLHEQERRNYLFAAKSGGWASVKREYDMGPEETVPFMRPLQGCEDREIEQAEKSWSEWLAMEDWMVGPRAPEGMREGGSHGGGGGGGQGQGHGREQQGAGVGEGNSGR